MIKAIERWAWIATLASFFAVLLLSIDPADISNTATMIAALAKALGTCIFVWLTAFILFDIFFKGIVEDVNLHDIDELEEGLLQRVREAKSQSFIGYGTSAHRKEQS